MIDINCQSSVSVDIFCYLFIKYADGPHYTISKSLMVGSSLNFNLQFSWFFVHVQTIFIIFAMITKLFIDRMTHCSNVDYIKTCSFYI